MFLLIRYPGGIIMEAMVLASGKNRMRVAAAGFQDAIELRRSGQQWFTATRKEVEFDFLMSNARQGESVSSLRGCRAALGVSSAATQ